MIDRIAPTRRPPDRAAGYQRWRSLLFLHWPVNAALLRPFVPSELALDLYEGTAYLGVVPFAMEGVRPHWCPEVLAFKFLETNVRTYVLHNDTPGVLFFSLEASSRLAVLAARTGWGLPYYYARMAMTRAGEEFHYQSRRARTGALHQVHYHVGESLGPSRPDTLEHFFLERYLLFVKRGPRLLSGQVHHMPYPVHAAHVHEVHDQLVAAAGLPAVTGPPAFAHYSPGVDVEVFPLREQSGKPLGARILT